MPDLLRWTRNAVLMLIAGSASAAAQILPINARLYDRNYGDFNYEFDDGNSFNCAYDWHKFVTGMLEDTLIFDAAKGKKMPRRGLVNGCSDSLDKWFDPAFARVNTCGNLFLENIGGTGKPVWKIQDNQFFPMDSLSKQNPWTTAGGAVLGNDFTFCMEINAGIVYHGGETMKFNGDDDLWVYVDDRLAVDQGGIHNAMETVTYLDSLPFLAGKQGRNLDLDIYYCSRRPPTSVFGMETDLELKPLPVKSLQIVDTLGKPLNAQDIVVGKTRLCALPSFQLPGEQICGNYKLPKGLSFLAADWDLNGRMLSKDGGSDCLDLDPVDFPDNTRLNLTAKAEDKTSRISLTLVRAAHPLDGVIRGVGRAESVELRLDSASGAAADGLEVRFDLDGKPRLALVLPEAGAATGGARTLQGALDNAAPGRWGFTGFPAVAAVTRQYLFGRQLSQTVQLRDGVSPVLVDAKFHWGPMDGYPAYLDVAASEPLSAANPSADLFLAKRRTGEPLDLPAGGAQLQARAADSGRYRLLLTDDLAARLASGDSLSLSGVAADSAGNHAEPRYLALKMPGNMDGTLGPVRMQADPTMGAPFTVTGPAGNLIPVSLSQTPLLDRESDRVQAPARGPVVLIPALVPLRGVRLRFHDNLGGFVNSVERDFSSEDWDRIRAASPGDTTWVRLMWYPVSRSGAKLGTGVYVAEGEIFSRDGALVAGASGETLRVRGATYFLEPRLFGYIRN